MACMALRCPRRAGVVHFGAGHAPRKVCAVLVRPEPEPKQAVGDMYILAQL